MILRVVLRDGRDVGVAFVRHEDDAGLEAVDLVRLTLGDDHEATGDERLACAFVARHVEDGARLHIKLIQARRVSRIFSYRSWRPSSCWRPSFQADPAGLGITGLNLGQMQSAVQNLRQASVLTR